jgi:predicted acylesterase/phospholipase RssA
MPPRDRDRLRPDWPYRRLAVVLSGGGALGAYEVGVLKVLERIGLRPAIVAGVSVGATNAVVWLAHGLRTEALERAWKSVRPSSIGMSWVTLAVRALGAFLVLLAALEVALTLGGAPELSLHGRLRGLDRAFGIEVYSFLLESLAWIVVGALGYAMVISSRRIETLLDHLATASEPEQRQRWLGRAIVAGGVLYLVVALLGIPWPWRFHASALLAAALAWVAMRPGRLRDAAHHLFLRLLPETGGRGLWRSGARRRLLERLVARGQPGRLLAGDVHLIISACAVDNGRMSYFVNWRDVSAGFRGRIYSALGEVVVLADVRDVVDAAVASGSLPVVFEPAGFRGREYLDGGLFSNQPLQAAVADGADAVLMVLVSPSSGPPAPSAGANLVELGARVQELANWRDLQHELQVLPAGWSRRGDPARVCVVEPPQRLPGSPFGFDPLNAAELIGRGEHDAWEALAAADWVVPGGAAGAAS